VSTVDVIVPCYKYGHYLRQCVNSVLSQAGVSVRVLIIDDESPDDTPRVGQELAATDARVTYRRHISNKGHIATYNEGIEWCSSDYVLLLSADDYLLPGALGRAASLMDEHPDVGFVFGNSLVLEDTGVMRSATTEASPASAVAYRVLSGHDFIQLSGSRNIVPTPTAVVRTVLQKRVGGYRAELPHTADMHMWLMLAAHAAVGVTSAAQAVYRRHSGNMSLGYRWLNDLKHREAAINAFLIEFSSQLQHAGAVRNALMRSLALDVVGAASEAFNQGQLTLSTELLSYAKQVFPSVRGTWAWTKVSAKRLIGRSAWRTIQRPRQSIASAQSETRP
jgi:glycosyltransferase involved in cell wall biosynthesis